MQTVAQCAHNVRQKNGWFEVVNLLGVFLNSSCIVLARSLVDVFTMHGADIAAILGVSKNNAPTSGNGNWQGQN
jgi:hypothetical protein